MAKCKICDKRAYFNYKEEKTGKYCTNHKLNGMIDVKSKRCLNCDKRQNFNYEGKTKALYCNEHKLDGMINVKHTRCLNCYKIPSFNYEGKTKALYCSQHKLDGMIDVISKRCLNCNKIPAFNYEGKTKYLYCSQHKLDGMINVKHTRCLNCNKIPNFNYEGKTKDLYCNEHKLDGMINVKHTRCLNCDKRPTFNYEGEKKTLYCNEHKLVNMINVAMQKCPHCDMNYVNKKYKPHCFDCYRFLNPNSTTVRNYKIKENTIMKFVKEKYPTCILDSTIEGGCSKRRPDGLIEFDEYSIIVEIDENSHKSYEDICENKRMMEIFQDLGSRPLRVIRFNPDSYSDVDGRKHNSIFSIDKESKKLKVKSNKELDRRVQILLETIDRTVSEFNYDDKTINVEYLSYNEDE